MSYGKNLMLKSRSILVKGDKGQMLSCSFSEIWPKVFYFLKKWAILCLFFIYFQSFQNNITIFTTNICAKMSIQYPVPGFELMTLRLWVSSFNHKTRALARKVFYLTALKSALYNFCTINGQCCVNNMCGKYQKISGRSRGHGWQLIFERSWARISARYIGWTFFTLIWCKKCFCLNEKT